MQKPVVVALAAVMVGALAFGGWTLINRKARDPAPTTGADLERPANQGSIRRTLAQGNVTPKTPEELQGANDAGVVLDREERCRFGSQGPVEPPDDPALAEAFRAAVRAGRWDEARWFLYIGLSKPPGLTDSQLQRLRREELSLELFRLARRGAVRDVKRVLRLGADPNTWIKLDDVATPLAWAAACNQVEVVRALLDAGADPNQRFWWGHGHSFRDSTPLFFAARFGSTEAARLLVERGAEVNAVAIGVDRWDETRHWQTRPLDWAETRQLRRYLRSVGAKGDPPGRVDTH